MLLLRLKYFEFKRINVFNYIQAFFIAQFLLILNPIFISMYNLQSLLIELD